MKREYDITVRFTLCVRPPFEGKPQAATDALVQMLNQRVTNGRAQNGTRVVEWYITEVRK